MINTQTNIPRNDNNEHLLVGLAGAPLPEDEDQLIIPPTNTDHRKRKKDKINNLMQSVISPSATVKYLFLN